MVGCFGLTTARGVAPQTVSWGGNIFTLCLLPFSVEDGNRNGDDWVVAGSDCDGVWLWGEPFGLYQDNWSCCLTSQAGRCEK